MGNIYAFVKRVPCVAGGIVVWTKYCAEEIFVVVLWARGIKLLLTKNLEDLEERQ